MSTESEILLRAASLMRGRAEAATPGPWVAEYSKKSGHCVIDAESINCLDSVARTTHYRDSADAEHIAGMDPAVTLMFADLLDGIATRHAPSAEPVELILHYDDGPCEVCEDGGHEVTVCEGCYPTWDGMDGNYVYPCAEVRAALPVARAYLGESS